MKKKNNGGFLLSESLIVSTFVLTVITLMFVQFKGIVVNNKKQYVYNNVEDIYSLGSLAEFFTNNNVKVSGNNVMIFTGGASGSCSTNVASASRTLCTTMAKGIGAEYIYYTDSNIDTVKSTVASSTLNQDLKDFVERLNADKVEGRKRLIAKFLNGDFATVIIPDKLPVYVDPTCSEVVYNGNSGCSKTCGGGTMTQYAYDKNNTSIRCPGKDKTNVACNTQACPTTFTGTIYRWSTVNNNGSSTVTEIWEANENISSKVEGIDYVKSASAVKNMSSSAAKYYLKHSVVNNVVTESYICIITNTEKCFRGGDPSYYSSNISVLQNVESWFNSTSGSCIFASNYVCKTCSNNDYFVYVCPSGGADANDYDAEGCSVISDGRSYCT